MDIGAAFAFELSEIMASLVTMRQKSRGSRSNAGRT